LTPNPSVGGHGKRRLVTKRGRRDLATEGGSHVGEKRRFLAAVGGGVAVPLEFEEGATASALAK
jgi:hypothetical protein